MFIKMIKDILAHRGKNPEDVHIWISYWTSEDEEGNDKNDDDNDDNRDASVIDEIEDSSYVNKPIFVFISK